MLLTKDILQCFNNCLTITCVIISISSLSSLQLYLIFVHLPQCLHQKISQIDFRTKNHSLSVLWTGNSIYISVCSAYQSFRLRNYYNASRKISFLWLVNLEKGTYQKSFFAIFQLNT